MYILFYQATFVKIEIKIKHYDLTAGGNNRAMPIRANPLPLHNYSEILVQLRWNKYLFKTLSAPNH